MKKFALLMLVLSAQTTQAAPSFTGFYATGAIGGVMIEPEISRALTASAPPTLDLSFSSDITIEVSSTTGWIGAGYSRQFQQNFVLAGEVSAGFANAKIGQNHALIIDTNLISNKTNVKLKNDFAVLFKPGYVFMQRTQLYALAGARWGNIESELITTTISVTETDKESSYQLGYTLGLGLEHLVTDQLSLGLQYAYTNYGEIGSLQTDSQVFGGALLDVTDISKTNLSSNALGFELTYYF